MSDVTEFPRLKIALSDCLRGTECRYNGGHAQDDFVKGQLAKYADFFPFCPEDPVLGTPRETIRLVNIEGDIRVRGTRTGQDVTDGILAYTQKMVPAILKQGMDAAVVKSRSPSCGLERIKIYRPTGEWFADKDRMDQGLFTAELQRQAPQLAIEEEGRLNDAWLRENFMMHAFTVARWRVLLEKQPGLAEFQAFHRDHKYLLLSKHQALYRTLGQIVAEATTESLVQSLDEYQQTLFELLSFRSNRGTVINTLQHIYGYFKKSLGEEEKQLFHESLDEFHQGIIPLIAVIKVLQQFLKHYGSEYLETQVFFHPYPAELALRSKVTAYR